MFCNNCGKNGHGYATCVNPITSLGIIAFKYDTKIKKPKYLMVCRKDTYGFVCFIRGTYNVYDKNLLDNIASVLTNDEKHRLLPKASILYGVLYGVITNVLNTEEKSVTRVSSLNN